MDARSGGDMRRAPDPRADGTATDGRGPICGSTVAGLASLHVGGAVGVLYWIFRPSHATLVLAGVLYALSGLSVTAGYHRLFAHRTYKASAVVRWVFLGLGAAAFQNSALSWSADHRAHHADTDGSGDPHAVTKGAWYAHVGWLFRRRQSSADVSRLKDLWALPSLRLQHRFYPVVSIGIGLVLPGAIAATWGDFWGGVLVAGFVRAAVLLQATFCVNSVAHLLGSRRYDPRASARDSTLTALMTFGEGYHSFHHRFPFDYRNGVHRWHYDPTKWLIWSLARARLATKLRRASPASIRDARARAADPPVASAA